MCVTREFTIILIFMGFCEMKLESTDTSSKVVKYEPLYVVEKSGRYTFVNSMIFDSVSQKHVFLAPNGFNIELACPKSQAGGIILESVGQPVTSSFSLGQLCDNPVEIYIEKFPISDNHYSVGFLMYKEGADFTSKNLNKDLPPTHNSISLMVVNFDKTEALPASVWYSINFGEWIQIESSEPVNNMDYEKNDDIFGFDIDEGYPLENQHDIFSSTFKQPLPCPLLKIQLAPAEDFFLNNFKKISRININTAPIWQRVLPQWRSLEKFVRKVARVLGKLTVITGTFDLLLFPVVEGGTKAFYLHTATRNITVPKYFWKAVIYRHEPTNDPEQNYGIIFIMVNDPYFGIRKRKLPRFCDDVIKRTGWDLHAEPGTSSEILACPLTQLIMRSLQGGKLPISKYKILNLNQTPRSYNDNSGNRKIEMINVMDELKYAGLL